MKSDALSAPILTDPPPVIRPVQVLVVFQDVPARMRIQQIYWVLMRELAREFDFECVWVGFDDLQDPRRAKSARYAAAKADLILFSVDADGSFPESVREWIETWMGFKADQDAALAALLNADDACEEPGRALIYLEEVARTAGMTFVPETIGPRRSKQLAARLRGSV